MMYIHSNNEIDKRTNVSKIGNNISTDRRAVSLFQRCPNFLTTQCRIDGVKHACQKPGPRVQSFPCNSGCDS